MMLVKGALPFFLADGSEARDGEVRGRRAVAVARDALGYGKDPWCRPLGDDVRTQAAGVLGNLEPMYRDPALITQLCAALREETSGKVRDALYSALLRLVTATEAPSSWLSGGEITVVGS